MRRAGRDERQHHAGERGLAAAALADDAERLARRELEADAATARSRAPDRRPSRPPPARRFAQVADLQQRRAQHRLRRDQPGLSARQQRTCRPSPRLERGRRDAADGDRVRAARMEAAAGRHGGRRRHRPGITGSRTCAAPSAWQRAAGAYRDAAAARRERATGAISTISPAYITTTRSAMRAITPMSWVMSRIAVPCARPQLLHQAQDLRLDRDVERGRRLVGDQQLRPAGHRHRDHDALAHAAGQLVRIVVDRARPRRDADRSSEAARRRAPRRRRQAEMRAQHLADLEADREQRVEARHRLLEDHADVRGRARAACRPAPSQRDRAVERMLPPSIAPCAPRSRMMASAVTDLPEPLSPTMPTISPGATAKETSSSTSVAARAAAAKATVRSSMRAGAPPCQRPRRRGIEHGREARRPAG